MTKIDRLARSIVDLNSIISSLNNSGVTIIFLDNALTFEPNKSDSMQTLMMNMLGSFAQFERDLIVTRTQEGKQWHRANNKNYREGRPKRVLNDKYKHALELMETNSMREVERKTGISLSTLKRIKKQAKEEQLLSEKYSGVLIMENREKIIQLFKNPLVTGYGIEIMSNGRLYSANFQRYKNRVKKEENPLIFLRA